LTPSFGEKILNNIKKLVTVNLEGRKVNMRLCAPM